jgi:hypothetical protein
VADKLTPLVTAAVARAAAAPAGTLLLAAKGEAGLFPPTAAGKAAAQKAVTDNLLAPVGSVAKGKQVRPVYAATPAGTDFLLATASPRQVLDDFVRVVEERAGQVRELTAAATRLGDELAGLRDTLGRLLPRVVEGNRSVSTPAHHLDAGGFGGGLRPPANPVTRPAPDGPAAMTALAPPAVDADHLAEAVLTRLADWAGSAVAGQDCPLPDLYRSLAVADLPPTVGAFHDCLRALFAARKIYLHPWTGPLYALPEPTYALLAGHNVAYYASACH